PRVRRSSVFRGMCPYWGFPRLPLGHRWQGRARVEVYAECGAGADMGVTQGTVGTGSARQHHGELFQGSLYRNGEWVSCLITMPGRGVGSTARFWPRDDGDVEVVPAWKKKARRAALLALGYIGVPLAGKLE